MKANLHNSQKSKLEQLDEQDRIRRDFEIRPIDLKRLKELHKKLPQPWVATKTANGGRYYVVELSRAGARGIWDSSGTATEDVCELIALLRNQLPYFIELVEKVTEQAQEAYSVGLECKHEET